jgi:peptidoglycan/xylan/chitin deacetylase (PgdA/CDA1 family)
MLSTTDTGQQRIFAAHQSIKNILAFHKLTNQWTFGSTNYSPHRFFNLLQNLKDFGFKFNPVARVLDGYNPKLLAITFDDGYAHLTDTLTQLIEKFGFRPTVFVPTYYIGKENNWDYSSLIKSDRHLDFRQITELSKCGVEFGSHGHNHIDLTELGSEMLKKELLRSKDILEDLTGREVISISYPFGRFNRRIMDTAFELGYRHGYTMKFPAASDNPLNCGRIPVYFFDNSTFVRQKLNAGGLYKVHRGVGRFINCLSYGTVLLNRISRHSYRPE